MQLSLGERPQSIEVHQVMIGGARARGALALLTVVAAVGICLGLRPADPTSADPPISAHRREQLAAMATAADALLARLSDTLDAALEEARLGAALTGGGDRPPATALRAAATLLDADAATADAARRALEAHAGTAASVAPGSDVRQLSYSGPELLTVAAQLREAADAATVFVERRTATQAVVAALGAAVAALDGDRPAAALEHLDDAIAPLAILEDWDDRPPLLHYWESVIVRLLDAARGIAVASIEGDADAVAAAAARYGEAAKLAGGADNALAVTLAEESAAVTVTPLRRLAALAREASDVRAALADLLSPAAL
ncbi:MAG: hypothetical protein WD116_00020 [Chloroflexota bacterium]